MCFYFYFTALHSRLTLTYLQGKSTNYSLFNSYIIALRKAKIAYNFGLSECNKGLKLRLKYAYFLFIFFYKYILFSLDVSPIMKLLSLKDPDQKTEIKYLHFVLENHLTFPNWLNAIIMKR